MDLINLYIDPNPEDSSGVTAQAIVSEPATEEGFFAFGKQAQGRFSFQVGGAFKPANNDKQIIMGALMVPDIEIPRIDGDKKYLVRFTSETIEQIAEKYSSKNINTAINQMHDPKRPVDAVMFQHFIINRDLGIMPPLGQDHLPNGTWFGVVKIKDKNVWDSFIKTGIYKGFSVEGFFYEEPVLTEKEAEFLAKSLV